jgi:hypothetical protein
MKTSDLKRPEAVSLLDLRRSSGVVDFGNGQSVEFRALKARDFASLLERFPIMAKFVLGAPLTLGEVQAVGPDCVAAIIAASQDHCAEPEWEEAAAAIGVEFIPEILEKIWGATFTRGFGPFASKIAEAVMATTAPAGKAPATKSPTPSPTSPDQTKSTRGNSAPDNSPATPSSPADEKSSAPEPPSSSPPMEAAEAANP